MMFDELKFSEREMRAAKVQKSLTFTFNVDSLKREQWIVNAKTGDDTWDVTIIDVNVPMKTAKIRPKHASLDTKTVATAYLYAQACVRV